MGELERPSGGGRKFVPVFLWDCGFLVKRSVEKENQIATVILSSSLRREMNMIRLIFSGVFLSSKQNNWSQVHIYY